MGLAADIGLRRIELGIQRVELLIQPGVGRDPGIDRATNDFAGCCRHHETSSLMDADLILSRNPKNRCPFHRVPVMAKATADRLSKVLAVPGKAVSHHHGPLRPSIPFAHQDGTDPEVGPALRQFSRQSSGLHRAAAAKLFEKPDCIGGEIA